MVLLMRKDFSGKIAFQIEFGGCMAGKKSIKRSGARCPKCRAKLEISEFAEKCRRCGYIKHLEPSNRTKWLLDNGTYGLGGWI